MTVISRISATLLALAALAGCAYQGGDIGDPLTRKAHWFSFVEGEDIRAACAPGTPDRARLVYNGIYDEQLRIYEVDGLRRQLAVKVVDQGGGSRLSLEDPAGPWRADAKSVPLDQAGYDQLMQSLAASGAYAPPAVGLDLPSRSYFWTAATCKDGRYGFTAWKYPSPAFAALTFGQRLFALDPTGIAVNQPKQVPYDPLYENKARRLEVPVFTLKVGAHGLAG